MTRALDIVEARLAWKRGNSILVYSTNIEDILRRDSLQNAGEETVCKKIDYKENQIFTHVVFKELEFPLS